MLVKASNLEICFFKLSPIIVMLCPQGRGIYMYTQMYQELVALFDIAEKLLAWTLNYDTKNIK